MMISSTYQRGLDYLDRVNESSLLDKKEGDERPFWRILADNFVTHPMIHIWDLLLKSDRIDKMIDLFGEEFSARLRVLDNSPDWLALIDYNLACVFSLSGELTQSIARLAKALNNNPELREWSKKDSDLDLIRDHPDYKVLYTD